MRAFTLTLKSRGSLLVGGGGRPDGVHGAHVVGGDGRPFVPASALRGALRETLEALLRGDGQVACDAGSGVAPPRRREDVARECSLLDGAPCLACQLFGGARSTLGATQRDFSSLVVGDARWVDDPASPDDARRWMTRPGVAIARSERSAAEDRFFLRRTTATRATFLAEAYLRDDAHWNLLTAAARATTHLGAGRSRGMGVVCIDVVETQLPAEVPTLPAGTALRVSVTLRAPALFGEVLASENVRETRHEVPGAALRGALGFAIARDVAADEQPAFDALVAETGARFGFLTPVGDGDATKHGALPITARWCKVAGRAHGLIDVIFDRIAAMLAPTAAHVAGLPSPECAVCRAPLRNATGYRGQRGEVAVRSQTRVSIERSASSAREEALFTEVSLEAGNRFAGVIRRVPDGARDLLARGLRQPLSLGRGRGQGRGRVDVTVEPVVEHDVSVRGAAFDDALAAHLQTLGWGTEHVGRLVPVVFLSPYAPTEGEADDARPLAAAVGGRCLLRARRFVREGTWDQRGKAMQAFQAAAAGAVYVVELPEGDHWRRHVDALAALEADGVGARCHQGYGELRVFDPVLFQREGPMAEAQREGVAAKALVEAAEAVMEEADRRAGDDAWRTEKTQLNTLIGVCGEATCAEEITNYLRYQASRDRAPWGLSLVERTVAGIDPLIKGKTDRERVDAWRHYAVYLMRAFTYRAAVRKAGAPAGGGRRDGRR